MTKNEVKQLILSRIEQHKGIKSTSLFSLREINALRSRGFDYADICHNLILNKEMISLDYMTPEGEFMSFYLPKGTLAALSGMP